MRYVPSQPPPISGGVDLYESRPLPGVKAVRSVQPRSLPPLVFQRRTGRGLRKPAVHGERRHDPHVEGERRTYCRRTKYLPVLLELRAGHDRRRHRQRSTDIAEHLDEEV